LLRRSLVRLGGQRREAGLEPVVERRRRERPRQEAAGPWGERLERDEPGRRPHPGAARAGEELADRLPRAAGLDRLLVTLVRLTLDKWLAQEARHLVVRDRAGRLERRRREHRQIEGVEALRPSSEQAREGRDAADPGAEDPDERGIRCVRRRGAGRHGASVPAAPEPNLTNACSLGILQEWRS
jgi:hypothetical protein